MPRSDMPEVLESTPMQNKSLIARLLYRLSGRLRCRVIDGNDGQPYLERYHLFRLPGGGGVYIHRFLASDPDRGLHDHPWKHALGIILSGGYRELRLDGDQVVTHRLKPGRLNLIRGEDFHRIILPTETDEAWTLFAHTAKVKPWGFLKVDAHGERRYVDHEISTQESSHENWWKTAPRGKDVARRR